jgi:hypothetical protein
MVIHVCFQSFIRLQTYVAYVLSGCFNSRRVLHGAGGWQRVTCRRASAPTSRLPRAAHPLLSSPSPPFPSLHLTVVVRARPERDRDEALRALGASTGASSGRGPPLEWYGRGVEGAACVIRALALQKLRQASRATEEKKQIAKANGSQTADQQIERAGRRKHKEAAEEGDGNTSRLPRRKTETYSKMWMAQIWQAKKSRNFDSLILAQMYSCL